MAVVLGGLSAQVNEVVYKPSSRDGTSCHRWGVFEVLLDTLHGPTRPYLDANVTVAFTTPSGAVVSVDAFYDGETLPASSEQLPSGKKRL